MGLDMSVFKRGTHPVSRSELALIPVPERGERSSRWQGVPHGLLADTLVTRLQAAKLEVTEEQWQVARGGQQCFGLLDISSSGVQVSLEQMRAVDESGVLSRWEHGYSGFDPEIIGIRIGVISGNDSSHALKLAVLPKVLICGNGLSVDGAFITLARRHTKGLHLVEALDRGIERFLRGTQQIQGTIDDLKSVDLSDHRRAEHLILEIGRQGIVPWSGLSKVDEHWRDPEHEVFAERTGWALFNSVTHVARGFSLRKEMVAVDRARNLILAEQSQN